MENLNQTNNPANMGKRIISAIIIVIVLGAFIGLRQISESTIFLFDILIGFLMILGTFEVEGVLRKMDRPVYNAGLGLYPVVCFAVLIISILTNLSYIYFLLLCLAGLVLTFLGLFLFGILAKKTTIKNMYLDGYETSRTRYVFDKSLNTVLGCIYPTFLLCFLFLINHFELFTDVDLSADVGLLGIILLFVTTFFADTCAMLTGRLIKSKKINLEKLGKGKSWSGFVGGIVGAMIGAIIIYFIFNAAGYATFFAEHNVQWWQFLVLGVIFGLVNMTGDIIASYIKRRAEVKDFSDFIPGHGGTMDRINGLVFNCVIVFVFMVLLFLA